MSKATVTYHAPEGDNAVVIFFGVRFFDGQSQEFGAEHGALIAKAHRNPHFAVSMSGAASSDPGAGDPAGNPNDVPVDEGVSQKPGKGAKGKRPNAADAGDA
jgi:hypothetical protein